ncbi:NAD(+) diphosphatase [Rodentibacter heidelbergensis]|uniref:NAD-capped RNA hydrolase NudC n=1 Tax=Rodentibacter heidelbergensis TaxID=1908258 RepID=A0A1V3I700_9PAST|nr:NAD(+) diphosphatase [Rodentibacter heidelbergensis]OOF35794.1 NADH pyrophosphatase [Rodentibacter heidelbergensis]
MHAIQPKDDGYWLLTQGSQLYLIQGKLPYGKASSLGFDHLKGMRIGEWDNEPLWLLEEQHDETKDYVNLRTLLFLPEEKFYLLSRGVEINHFLKTHQFCGRCGHRNSQTEDELAMQCCHCGYRTYPVIHPSIIVAVRRGTQILLANHKRHYQPNGGMYTTLAGFVEAGETFEQAVMREVWEETGIKIKNIRYFGSQPWAFPNSQMVGFLADYEGGEIVLQETEIHDAQWFSYHQPLPELPPTGTIARKLIHATLELCQAADQKKES